MRKFVVTGCGRSGTTYTAEVLKALGLNVEHEVFFRYIRPLFGGVLFDRRRRVFYWRTVDWEGPLQGEIAWQAAPFLERLPSTTVVFHQVRHPFRFVRSRLAKGLVFGHVRNWYVPVPHGAYRKHDFEALPLEERIAYLLRFWVEWNGLVEAVVPKGRRFRVEDLDEGAFATICREIECSVSEEQVAAAVASVPTNTNTRDPKDVEIDLKRLPSQLRKRLERRCERYGYELSDR